MLTDPSQASLAVALALAGAAGAAAVLAPWRDLTPAVVLLAATAAVGGLPTSAVALGAWGVALLALGVASRRAAPRVGPLRGAVLASAALHLGVGAGHLAGLPWRSVHGGAQALGAALVVLALGAAVWRRRDPRPVRWVGHIPVATPQSTPPPTTSS